MSRLIVVLVLFCSSIYSDYNELKENWKFFLSTSRNSKVLYLSESINNSHKDKSYHSSLIDSLKDFSLHHDLEDSILLFLHQELNLNRAKVFLEAVQKQESSDEDHASVFFVYKDGKDGDDPELITVVKSFPQISSFARELSGLHKLYSLKLKQSSTVYPLAVGKVKCSKPAYLIALSVAPGKTLTDLALELKGFIGKGREREFKKFKKAISQLGLAIAELHQSQANNAPIYPRQARISWMLDSFTPDQEKIMKKHKISLNTKKMQGFFKQLDDQVTLHFPSRFCTHGDLNWNNVFYNEETETITLIDVPSVTEWNYATEENQALYRALRDYSAAFSKIRSPKLELLKREQKELEEEYLKVYMDRGIAKAADDEIVEIFWRAAALHGIFHCHVVSLKHHYKESKEYLINLKKDLKEYNELRDKFNDFR